MTGSTYKSFGGPPSGMVLTDDADLAARLDAIAYPGLTANFDLARTAALALAVLDLLEHGAQYAQACLANAVALAEGLAAEGVAVFEVPGRGYTASQHVAVEAIAYGGGDRAAKLLEPSDILTSSIALPIADVVGQHNALRLGTQEITRWGMAPSDMSDVARLMARVLVDGEADVRADVHEFRAGFQTVHFVRP